ncbi:uncharacterized protein LOC116296331, partial [Actinia tenebrosa]|uniref:Uncharacterized protein LOC116296331 n=1 Tax=Actinia tenebrosa TaxID=6105 RepID=A0A6P8I5F0_ACTTE
MQLLDTHLVGDLPIIKAKTPTLGNRSVIYLNVTASDIDGEIGFEKLHQTILVQEPEGPSSRNVILLVVRDVTAGRATAEWTISSSNPSFYASDIGASRGMITFEK